jgi:ribosomal-protein-alanine N-acetyltransferase
MHARRLADDPTDPEWGPWLADARHRRLLVGSAGFHGPPEPDGTVELGYGIAASERRLGYATEAAEGLTRWALGRPGVTRVVARAVLADNEPSLRVLERLGYRRTREGDGTVDWEILS